MKLNPNQNLTQQPTSDIVDYYTALEAQSIPGQAVFHSPSSDGYPKYLDRENDPYCRLKCPNPPTPEAVAKAQFIDKTYNWKGSAANQAANVQPSN